MSTGGPATYVTWITNTALAHGRKKSALDDPVTAQYTHNLALNGRLEGRYTCVVANHEQMQYLMLKVTNYVQFYK